MHLNLIGRILRNTLEKMKLNRFVKASVVGILLASAFGYFLFWYSDKTKEENSLKVLDQMEAGRVPGFTLPGVFTARPFTLDDEKAKIFVISFWATWCAPCVEEFPSMVDMVEQMGGDLKLITISADDNLRDVKDFLMVFKGQNDNIINVWDPDKKIAEKYGTELLPENYIVDSNFRLVRKFSSMQKWNSPGMISFLKQFTK